MSTTAASTSGAFFQGYRRHDGSFGVRNHLLVLSTVALTNRWAHLAAADTPDAVVIAGDFLRGLRGPDPKLQDDVIEKLVRHPNVGGVVLLGFDRASTQAWRRRLDGYDRPLAILGMMEQVGVSAAVNAAREALADVDRARRRFQREAAPLSALTVALECGGSDATSAICANPAIGRFMDRLIAAGGSAVVSETAEFVGAEEVVRARAATPEVGTAVLACIDAADERTAEDGERYRGVNPTAENIDAGLTTLVEKSMGAVCKIGGCRIDGCLSFGEAIPASGMYFMDTPFFSPVSLTGMVVGGAQLVLFAMGVFNPSGNPLAPTMKICGNRRTLESWGDAIDLDVSGLTDGTLTLDAAGELVAQAAARVASGDISRAEFWGEGQVIVPKTCPLI